MRPRKLDYRKKIPVFKEEDLPGLDEEASRAIPVVSTGVEKEEEEEHHLQAAMSSQASASIPVPKALSFFEDYNELYSQNFKLYGNLTRFANTVEECVGVNYCADDEDFAWFDSNMMGSNVTVDQFEAVLNELENLTAEKQKLREDNIALSTDLEPFLVLESHAVREHVDSIYDYWQSKKQKALLKPLMPVLKVEENIGGDADPYVCFRKREIKMTRKTRRTDAQSVQRMRQLKSEFDNIKRIADMVHRREKLRVEYLMMEHAIFEQKLLIKNVKEQLGVPDEIYEEARAARKKAAKLSKVSSPSREPKTSSKRRKHSSLDEDQQPQKDPFMAQIEAEINIKKADNVLWEDLTESCLTFPQHPGAHFFMADVLIEKTNRCLPRARRRIGRGGRLIYDRFVGGCSDSIFKFDEFAQLSEEEDYFRTEPIK